MSLVKKSVSFNGNNGFSRKVPVQGRKVFLFRPVCHGFARLQLTFPFAQQSGFGCVDKISETPHVNCSEEFPHSTVQSCCKIRAG